MLRFNPKGNMITGSGNDENENLVSMRGFLNPKSLTNWSGYFETNDLVEEIQINQLNFKSQTIKGICKSEDGDQYELNGNINKNKKGRST